jgi:hypothetical protein
MSPFLVDVFTGSPWRNYLLNFGLLLVSTILALVTIEVGIRLFDVGPTFQVVYREIFRQSSNPNLRYELRPGAIDGIHTINSAGFRDREYEQHKPNDVFRIVAIGDSVTYGQPDSRDQTWAKDLERVLNRYAAPEDPHFEVLNLGVVGYNIIQVAERLAVSGLRFEPDLIIYGYVLNDPQEFSVEGTALNDVQDANERRFREGRSLGALRILSRSRLFLLVRHFYFSPAEPLEVRFRQGMDPGYKAFSSGDTRGRYFRNLHLASESRQRLERGLERLAEVAGTTPVLVAVFPLFLDSGSSGYPLYDVHEQLVDLCRAQGLPAEDLASAFDQANRHFGRGRVVADFVHPSAFGQHVAAIALYNALARRNAIPGIIAGEQRLTADAGKDGKIARVLAHD